MPGPYVTIAADPAWEYDDQIAMSDGVRRSSTSQYPTMSVQQVCDLYQSSQVQHVLSGTRGNYVKRPGLLAGYEIANTAVLFLWITQPLLLEGVHNRVCNAWGFTPRQIVPWIKGRLVAGDPQACEYVNDRPVPAGPQLILNIGMGHLFRGVVEYLIVATRGKYTKLVKHKGTPNLIIAEEDLVILAPRTRHSTKPEQAYDLIEKVVPGPYLELFARRRREGWTCDGNELRAYDEHLNQAYTDLQASGGLPEAQAFYAAEEEIEWP